jgi:uncharacterized protein (TIGR00251 family)
LASVVLQIRVKPGARASSLEEAPDGTWQAQIRARPVEGKANEELIGLVAARFGCRKADVTIKAGSTGRMKLVKVETP